VSEEHLRRTALAMRTFLSIPELRASGIGRRPSDDDERPSCHLGLERTGMSMSLGRGTILFLYQATGP
jgi:hypothetical protein